MSQRSHQLAPRAHAPTHPAEPLRILARPLGAERREPLAPLPLALAHQRRLLVASPLQGRVVLLDDRAQPRAEDVRGARALLEHCAIRWRSKSSASTISRTSSITCDGTCQGRGNAAEVRAR